MTAYRNATGSVGSIFAAVGSAATAVTVGFDVIGDSASVLNIKSKSWVQETRERDAALALDRKSKIIDDVVLSIGQRIKQRNQQLARDPELKAIYEQLLPQVSDAVNGVESNGNGNNNGTSNS